MNFPQHTPHNEIHPCLPLSQRLEQCWASAHFTAQCDGLRIDLLECFGQSKQRYFDHIVSQESIASDVRVPIFDIVNDRFEGLESDQTLRASPAINPKAKV